MLGLFLLWLVRRDFESGLSFHFIGMTAVTLLLDWPLAIVVGLVAQLGLCLLGRQDWLAIGVNGVLLVAIPALIAELAALFVEKRQPRNLFVYIFCCGFFRRPSPRWWSCCSALAWSGSTAFSRCRPGWRTSLVTCG